jgi:hypothetical protein
VDRRSLGAQVIGLVPASRAAGAVVAGLAACLALGFTAATASAATSPERAALSVVVPAASPVSAHVAPFAAATVAPPTTTPDINQQQQAADAAKTRRKVVIAVVAVVLLVIVYYGHRARYRHKVRVKNLQNAKS